jgi:hypothetical protein
VALIILFALEFRRRNGFLEIDFNKVRFSYLFIGYRNNRLSNQYEVWRTSGILVTSALVAGLAGHPDVQIWLTLGLLLVLFACTVWVDPFEKYIDVVCDLAFQSCLIGVLAITLWGWIHRGTYSEVAGWIAIASKVVVWTTVVVFLGNMLRDLSASVLSYHHARCSARTGIDCRVSTECYDAEPSNDYFEAPALAEKSRELPPPPSRQATAEDKRHSFGRLGTLSSKKNLSENVIILSGHNIFVEAEKSSLGNSQGSPNNGSPNNCSACSKPSIDDKNLNC